MYDRRTFLAGAMATALCGRDALATVHNAAAGFALFDTHVHFVSLDEKTYPRVAARSNDRADRNEARNRLNEDPVTAEANLKLWDENGVEGGLAVQYRSAYAEDNSYALDTAAAHRDRVWPVVVLDGTHPDTPVQLPKLVAERGAVGLRITGTVSDYSWLDSDAMLNTWQAAAMLQLPVEMMYLPRKLDVVALQHIETIAKQYPGVPIVLDHLGWPDDQGAPDYGLIPALRALVAQRRLYLKFTSINLDNLRDANRPAEDFLRHAVDVYGADRIMWGSDRGNTPGRYADLVSRAITATAKLSARERRLVLRETGRNVFVKPAALLQKRAARLLQS